MESIDENDDEWGLNDLRMILQGATATNSHLFCDGEKERIRTILALPRDVFATYSRLSAWKRRVFRLPGRRGSVDIRSDTVGALLLCGLMIELEPSPTRCNAFSVKELRDHLRIHGQPVGGDKRSLAARVFENTPKIVGRVFTLPQRDLVKRCEWLFFGGRGRGRQRLIIGRVRPSDVKNYALSASRPVFETRQQMVDLLDCGLAGGLQDSELVLRISEATTEARQLPWLDVRESYGRELLSRASRAHQQQNYGRAQSLYAAARHLHVGHRSEVVRREALALEAQGKQERGARLCLEYRTERRSALDVGLHRTGRRLCRAAGMSWAPDRPYQRAKRREVGLAPKVNGSVDSIPLEMRVGGMLQGRMWVHGEGRFWTSLFCLLFYDLLWIPVPGMLPAPCLPGPLDLGTTGFVARRTAQFNARLERLNGDHGLEMLESAFGDYGVRVRGLSWELCTLEQWSAFLRMFPRSALLAIMEQLGREGFREAAGLPDLVVWGGEPIRPTAVFPSRVPAKPFLIEVKSPNDSLSDRQIWWHHRLLLMGVGVEIWSTKTVNSAHENHGRTISRAPAATAEGRSGASNFRPGSRGTLFDLGAGS